MTRFSGWLSFWSRVSVARRVQVPNNLVLGFWVIVTIVHVLGKYLIIGYLGP